MMSLITPIEDLPTLSKRLGKRKVKRIQYAQSGGNQARKRGKNLENTVIEFMQGKGVGDPFCPINDVIAGVARLDHYGHSDRDIPLSQSNLYMIFQCLESINTQAVMDLLKLSERQAQVYCRACRLIHTQITKHIYESMEVNDPFIESGVSDIDTL